MAFLTEPVPSTTVPSSSGDRSAKWWLWAAIAWAVLLAGNLAWPAEPAQAERPNPERGVKAAFLYQFIGYVEWPISALPPPDAPITVGIINGDDMAGELRQVVAGRSVNNRPLAIKVLKDSDSLAGTQVLFIGGPGNGRLAQLLKKAQQQSILTVTETDGGLELGSVINFLLDDGRVRFEVALDSAEKSGLQLSSRMLAVAQHVRMGKP